MSIKIISGDILTNLPSNKEVYICQQVNCRGVMGAGLALKIRRKWPVVYQQYMEIPAWKEFLGSYQKVRVEPNIHVVNLFGQNNYGLGERQTNYAAFATALFTFFTLQCSSYKLSGLAPEMGWDRFFCCLKSTIEDLAFIHISQKCSNLLYYPK